MSDIRNFFNQFSKEEIETINKKQIDEAERDFKILKNQLGKGICYLCSEEIDTYNLSTPCLHWLARPKNLKKKDYEHLFASGVGYFRLNSYLRWLANTEILLSNINDLRDETSGNKKIEFTIKYKNFEWSLSCSKFDFRGHDKTYGNFPHYHLQMKIDGNIFIKFGDFHIPFNDEDLFTFQALEEAPDKFRYVETRGAGMQAVFDGFSPEELLNFMKTTDNYENAAYRLQTIVMAQPGKTISGDNIAKLAKESRETGVPMAKLLKKLDANIKTIISPGEGVPELKKRTPKKR